MNEEREGKKKRKSSIKEYTCVPVHKFVRISGNVRLYTCGVNPLRNSHWGVKVRKSETAYEWCLSNVGIPNEQKLYWQSLFVFSHASILFLFKKYKEKKELFQKNFGLFLFSFAC